MSGKAKGLKSGLMKTVSILSYIGNGICLILFLMLGIGCVARGTAPVDGDELGGAIFGSIVAFFLVLSIVIILISLLCIIGVIKMNNGNRKGFNIYFIANIVWIALVFYGGRDGTIHLLLSGVISGVFILFFRSQLSKMT